jgi:hypothetical protein
VAKLIEFFPLSSAFPLNREIPHLCSTQIEDGRILDKSSAGKVSRRRKCALLQSSLAGPQATVMWAGVKWQMEIKARSRKRNVEHKSDEKD